MNFCKSCKLNILLLWKLFLEKKYEFLWIIRENYLVAFSGHESFVQKM